MDPGSCPGCGVDIAYSRMCTQSRHDVVCGVGVLARTCYVRGRDLDEATRRRRDLAEGEHLEAHVLPNDGPHSAAGSVLVAAALQFRLGRRHELGQGAHTAFAAADGGAAGSRQLLHVLGPERDARLPQLLER